ncbi:hypothetical protein C8Q80DRAFT_513277 [Daedaleopsis nitida]|nr:hypothetical protein C8Q80DRAFT_513277 [Daedaleopsis nitida]
MDAQLLDTEATVRQQKTEKSLRVSIPQAWGLDGDEEWQDPLPSPPPPTPSVARRASPYDTQRFDPYKVMVFTPTPHYTTPTSPEFAIDHHSAYPALLDSLTYKFPMSSEPESDDDRRASPVDDFDETDGSDSSFAGDSSFDSIDSGLATPGDCLSPFSVRSVKDDTIKAGYPIGHCSLDSTDALEDSDSGECIVDRTIVRPSSSSSSSSRTRSCWRSLTGLRSISSLSSFARGAGSLSGSRSGTDSGTSTPPSDEPSSECTDGLAAPPASRFASRRPSLVPGAEAGTAADKGSSGSALSSPVAAADVMRRLRKIASTLNLREHAHASAAERHFEEAVDRYARAWSADEGPVALEVCVTRTETVVPASEDEAEAYFAQALVRGRGDGVGLYAAAAAGARPRSRKTTLRTVFETEA